MLEITTFQCAAALVFLLTLAVLISAGALRTIYGTEPVVLGAYRQGFESAQSTDAIENPYNQRAQVACWASWNAGRVDGWNKRLAGQWIHKGAA